MGVPDSGGVAGALGMNTSGMLDPVIFEHLTARHGITDPWPQHDTDRALFVEELRAELARSVDQVRLMPGIASLITALRHRAQQRGEKLDCAGFGQRTTFVLTREN